jgi:two-component system sensor histidine kinase PfeS
MKLPNRHSLLWKLLSALGLLCLLLISLQVDLAKRINLATGYLSQPARQSLTGYARQAEAAWRTGGAPAVDDFLRGLREREQVWAAVVEQQRSLSSTPLLRAERKRLNFIRGLDWSVGRPGGTPTFYVPFVQSEARLVMELPPRFDPRRHSHWWNLLLERVLPAALALGLGILLYRALIAPMVVLRRQVQALSCGDLSVRVGPQLGRRHDEIGELARAFDHMAGRLESTLGLQRQLLRNLSHELRTPLSRLRVTGEREPDAGALRLRLEREVQGMERLVSDTLELAWLDTERPALALAPVDVGQLWEVLCEDLCFEAGWPAERLRCELPGDCQVMGNLNGLAQALENILRNAVRHSPTGGSIRLTGQRLGQHWLLRIEDQGPGVEVSQLESIFQPFTRLGSVRPGGDGFGLGLSIARSVVQLQGGQLWAQNGPRGLHMHLQLASV